MAMICCVTAAKFAILKQRYKNPAIGLESGRCIWSNPQWKKIKSGNFRKNGRD
jgi:hypothetical protein